jgi:hypothetical protein
MGMISRAVPSCKSQASSYRLHAANHKPQVTGFKLQTFMHPQPNHPGLLCKQTLEGGSDIRPRFNPAIMTPMLLDLSQLQRLDADRRDLVLGDLRHRIDMSGCKDVGSCLSVVKGHEDRAGR